MFTHSYGNTTIKTQSSCPVRPTIDLTGPPGIPGKPGSKGDVGQGKNQ